MLLKYYIKRDIENFNSISIEFQFSFKQGNDTVVTLAGNPTNRFRNTKRRNLTLPLRRLTIIKWGFISPRSTRKGRLVQNGINKLCTQQGSGRIKWPQNQNRILALNVATAPRDWR